MPEERNSAGPERKAGKVISLRGHQAAEEAVDRLLATGRHDPRYIQLVAQGFALGTHLLSAITRRLDAYRPAELLTLADISGRYPGRPQAVRALVRAANDRRAPDARRFGAVVALGMYDYGVILPPLHDFIAGLSSPASTVANAFVCALEGYTSDPAPHDWEPLFALLLSQPPELLYAVVGALSEGIPGKEDAAEEAITGVMGLLALHTQPDVAISAVDALLARPGSCAAEALFVLQPNLAPDLAHMVSRHLQKQRLSGAYDPSSRLSAPSSVSASMSTLDGKGRILLELVTTAGGDSRTSRSMEIMLSDTQGIIDAALGPVETESARAPLYGEQTLHRETLVPIPTSYMHDLLGAMARVNWSSGTALPVAYSLECRTIWEGAANESGQTDQRADLVAGTRIESDDESTLLSLPGLRDWYLDTPATHVAAKDIAASTGRLSRELSEENWRILLPSIIRLAHDEFVPEMRALYASRLRIMSRWLYFRGESSHAALAASAARTMAQSPPEANLFVLRLVQKGILVALSQL